MLRRLSSQLVGPLRFKVNAASTIFARNLKATTGIAGLDVVPDARNVLKDKINEIFVALKDIPEEIEYRKNVEATLQYRLSLLESEMSDEAVEDQFSLQLEEMIEECKDELSLIPKMAEWKPWEVPEGYTIECLEEEEVEARMEKK